MIARRPKRHKHFATVEPLTDTARREVVGILQKEYARRPRQEPEPKFTVGEVEVDPVAEALDTKPGKVNGKYRNAHDAFVTMIRAATSPYQKKFGVLAVLADWWSHAFPGRSFPPAVGAHANELMLTVQYGLLMQGYERYNIEPCERFKRNHDIAVDLRFGDLPDKLQEVLDYEQKTTLGSFYIKPKPESEQWQKSSGKSRRQPQPKSVPQSSAPNPKPIARRPRRKQ